MRWVKFAIKVEKTFCLVLGNNAGFTMFTRHTISMKYTGMMAFKSKGTWQSGSRFFHENETQTSEVWEQTLDILNFVNSFWLEMCTAFHWISQVPVFCCSVGVNGCGHSGNPVCNTQLGGLQVPGGEKSGLKNSQAVQDENQICQLFFLGGNCRVPKKNSSPNLKKGSFFFWVFFSFKKS